MPERVPHIIPEYRRDPDKRDDSEEIHMPL